MPSPPFAAGPSRPSLLALPACQLSLAGTGYTKMGFAGNSEPSFTFPTIIATREGAAAGGAGGSGQSLGRLPARVRRGATTRGGGGRVGDGHESLA